MKNTILFSLCLFSFFFVAAQNICTIKGRVTDADGKAIPYCSIYIPAIAKGSMANIDGEYSFNVPCNTYKIVFQSLGYETVSVEKSLDNTTEIDLQLNIVSYQLQAVAIDPSSEDPAYNYIRKATAMAEYYKKQIKAYQCNLYVRSFFDVGELPWIAKKLASEEDLQEMQAGDISETLLEYSYERPNKVREKILAVKSGRKDTSRTGSSYINLNFYNLGGPEMVNPLSRNAFQVYKFEHKHTYYEGSQGIHKIKIIPRRKGNDLMRGYIYINDKLWNINNVDVEFEQPLAKVKYQQQYNQVNSKVWMPTNHKIKVRVEAMGFELDVNYLATLNELSVETDSLVDAQIMKNLNLAPPEEQEVKNIPEPSTKAERKLSKTTAKIEEMLQQDKLSKAESLKLVRLIKKQEKEIEKQQDTVQSLEVKRNYKTEYADSAFSDNDSLWEVGRDIPLSEVEMKIYASTDSLSKVINGDTIVNKPQTKMQRLLFFNGTVKSKNKNIRFQPKGLLAKYNGGFNTVDGFYVSKEVFTYEWNNREGKFYKFTPTVGYAFARETYLGQLDFSSQYNKEKRAGFFFSAGRATTDFNRDEPFNHIINTASTLLLAENYKKYFQNDFIKLGHQFDIKNGLQLITTVEYEDRTGLRNYSGVKWTKRNLDYTPNIPDNATAIQTGNSFDDNSAFIVDLTASYTHKQRYRYTKQQKTMLSSNHPTFALNYRQGIESVANSNSDFQFLSLSIQQRTNFQLINSIRYHVETGKFFGKPKYFADYKNFNSQPFEVLGNTRVNSFKLLDSYSYNTNDFYFEGHLAIEDNHLLLKYLPLLNTTNLTETLHFNYLYTEENKHYTEIGYSLNRIFLLFDVGAYVSFEDDSYKDFGIRLGFQFLNN